MEPGLHYAKAQDLFDDVPEVADDIQARPDGEASLDFFTSLLRSPTPEEAVTFGAYLLPRRRAVWWGHECVRSVIHLLNDQDLRMLALAEAWVREPEENQRYLAMTEGMAARNKTPGVWIALAAGWTSGSLNPDPHQARVPPPPALTPRAINAGILSALARVDIPHRTPTLKAFVDMGVSLATR